MGSISNGNAVTEANRYTNGHASTNGSQQNGHPTPSLEPIAIVGMALRLPGKIHTPEALWDLIINKKTTRGPIPMSRYNVDGFYNASNRPGSVSVRHGHFLDESDAFDVLDTSLFSMSKAEVEKLDPQQRMLLEVVWECMENAGQHDWRGSNTGVFVGTWGDDWLDFLAKDPQQTGGILNTAGAGDFAISNRISYEYDLQGPSMTIKAACASSMICLHEASQALRNGECDAAIVAGTNLILTPTGTIAQCEAGVLSPTGECRTFDASANGYARGEAINAILIKRLDDALRHKDPIRAIVRSSAVNGDGRSVGLSNPNPKAHERLIRRAYEAGGLGSPSETPYVEVHGTGTTKGDPLELEAIANVFGDSQDTYIGGIKPNVGHGEGASGVTSIIKAVLALEKNQIPPQVNFVTPNPDIPFQRARLIVPLEATPWPNDRPKRISINSFGLTGANAHAILESADSYQRLSVSTESADGSDATRSHLLVFSASTGDSLKRRAADVLTYGTSHPESFKHLAHTLSNGRDHLSHRAYAISTRSHVGEIISSERVKQAPKVNFVFTGQGAQWATMGKSLIEDFPAFREDLVYLNSVLKQLPDPPSWDLSAELLNEGLRSRLDKAEFAQPLCTAIQIGLVNLLLSLGVTPSAVTGHSSGEIAAAYASGAVTAEEAIVIAFYRGLTTKLCSRKGAMAAVGIGRAEATLYLEEGVTIACENSPQSVTLSGDVNVIDSVLEQLRYDDAAVFARRLKTDGMAYHSHHMADIGPIYEKYIEAFVTAKSSTTAFFSSVTGKALDGDKLGADYWRRNLESPVKFFPAVKSMIESQGSNQLFLEIGPHSALAGPLRQIFKISSSKIKLSYSSSIVRGKNETSSILDMCGQLYLQTIPLNLGLLTTGGRILTDLPSYPWDHEASHWAENRVLREWRLRQFPPHELLGSRILEGNDFEPTWRNLLLLKDTTWLRDHKVLDDVVFPCAGYIAMAGEAARQISSREDFTIRNLLIQTALIVQDSTIELFTSLRKSHGTYANNDWYDFSIVSHNGQAWMKHCHGQVRGGGAESPMVESLPNTRPLPRRVTAPYEFFRTIGLHYGPNFQGLENLTALPGHQSALAQLANPPTTSSPYPVHPTTIDQCLQLLGMAAAEGLPRNLKKIPLPTNIDLLYIRPAKPTHQLHAEARATSVTKSGDIQGEMCLFAHDQLLLSIKDCQLSAFEQTAHLANEDSIAAARLSWRPDIDFVRIEDLMISHDKDPEEIRAIEEYGLLCTFEMQQRLRSVPDSAWQFVKFRKWIDDHVEEGQLGKNRIVQNSQDVLALSAEERLAHIIRLQDVLKCTQFVNVAELITRLLDNCEGIFDGSTEVLDIYLRDDGLTKLYGITGDRIESTDFFVSLGHTNPNLRVLEIGAGTGGTTLVALKSLTSIAGEPMYSNYTFTDISSGFFSAARERFAEFPALEFKILDISKDPISQGFEAGTYDLIVASNVIHATDYLNNTLKNVRKLLHPRGRFFLQELTPAAAKMINIIMGPLPGWWLGEADGRVTEPIISIDRWNKELLAAGFSGVEAVVRDDPVVDASVGANIIARPQQSMQDYPTITLLLRQEQLNSDPANTLIDALTDLGFGVEICEFGSPLAPYQDIISLVELDVPFFSQISRNDFENFQQIVAHLNSARLLWIMGPSQIESTNPDYSLTLGLARSVRAEMPLSFATLEADCLTNLSAHAISRVFKKFLDTANSVNPDHEFVVKNGIVHVGRYHWASVTDELTLTQDTDSFSKTFQVSRKGTFAVGSWQSRPLEVLGTSEVMIVSDFVTIGSQNSIAPNANALVCGYSGVITEIGTGVSGLQVGDRVMGLGKHGISTSLIAAASSVTKVPDDLDAEEFVTLAIPFATVVYALTHLAGINSEHSVLIHSAYSDIGAAAIKVSQSIGAEVYCTVDNDEEASHLQKITGFTSDRVFKSTNLLLAKEIKTATRDRGVDIVLNISAADHLEVSLRSLANGGKVIQLGPPEANRNIKLDMELLAGNKSISRADLSDAEDFHSKLLEEVLLLYSREPIQPISARHIFSCEEFQDALQVLQKDDKFSSVIFKLPTNHDTLQGPIAPPKLQFRGDVAYLVVGGVGGLGRAVSTYMAENGARHFIYLSRSAGSAGPHKEFFRELTVQGCTVQAFSGDIAQEADVLNVLTSAEHPIAGVLHLAMVLQDRPFLSMKHSDFLMALNPKVAGTWNLHNAMIQQNVTLDFFVMFGSISGTFGIAHQANYAAGNTFQDGFVQYRQSLGLPASVLNIGAMSGVGYVSENKSVEDYFRTAGMPFQSEEELFEALHLSLLQQHATKTPSSGVNPGYTSQSQLALGIRATKPMTDPSNHVLWKHDRRVDIYRNIEAARLADSSTNNPSATTGSSDALSLFMSSLRTSSSPLTLLDDPATLTLITLQLATFIYESMMRSTDGVDMELGRSLMALGVDSLVTIEVRNWIQRKFEVAVSTLEMLNGGSIENLGAVILARVKERFGKVVK
ncbi:hypothetical protein LTR84_012456 [Exophiala bonariae]|uniref:Carrier domain-containing protein n=1 Tax=Exophiala bonariae TaxID=1690606 RepID=A0AAV9NE82_9EURO|nr:hypothetical protein LTR84_012456 [Exophiala bonariae]